MAVSAPLTDDGFRKGFPLDRHRPAIAVRSQIGDRRPHLADNPRLQQLPLHLLAYLRFRTLPLGGCRSQKVIQLGRNCRICSADKALMLPMVEFRMRHAYLPESV